MTGMKPHCASKEVGATVAAASGTDLDTVCVLPWPPRSSQPETMPNRPRNGASRRPTSRVVRQPSHLPRPSAALLLRHGVSLCCGPEHGGLSLRPRAVIHAAVVRNVLGLRPLWRLKAVLKPKASA